MAIVIAIFIVIVGAVTVAQLPVSQFPQIAPPEVQVTGASVGADAQTIEQAVATPVEQQLTLLTLKQVKPMSSLGIKTGWSSSY